MMGEVESISEEIGSGKVRLFEDGRFEMMNHCYSRHVPEWAQSAQK